MDFIQLKFETKPRKTLQIKNKILEFVGKLVTNIVLIYFLEGTVIMIYEHN